MRGTWTFLFLVFVVVAGPPAAAQTTAVRFGRLVDGQSTQVRRRRKRGSSSLPGSLPPGSRTGITRNPASRTRVSSADRISSFCQGADRLAEEDGAGVALVEGRRSGGIGDLLVA